ncbi:MAG: sensor domain-containing diguanylate cyclase [Eubacteriales bacterium]|jgi:diguanylate cyclase (GGDEF)-like protein
MAGKSRHILYTWLIIFLGWVVLFLSFRVLNLDIGKEYIIMIALGVFAEWFAVYLPRGQLSGSFSIVFASYLIFGFAPAVWISALAVLFSQGIINRGNPLRTAFFNSSQYALSLYIADYLFGITGGQAISSSGLRISNLLPLLVFLVSFFAINHLLVNLYLFPGRKYDSRPYRFDTLYCDGYTYLFSIPFGVLMYLIYRPVGIIGTFLLFLPVLAVQFVLRLYVKSALFNKELLAFYQIAQKAGDRFSSEQIMDLLFKETSRVVPYYTGVIYLWSHDYQCFKAAKVAGPYKNQFFGSALGKGEGFIGLAIENKQAEIIYDSKSDPRLKEEGALIQVHRSLLVIPLFVETEILGALVLGEKKPLAFDQRHLRFLSVICSQTAIFLANKMQVKRIQENANLDIMTGIFNQRYFFEQVEVEFNRAKEKDGTLSLVLLDVDHFEKINEFFGYRAGNQILVQLAGLLKDEVVHDGLVARFGGEEFIISLPGFDVESSRKYADSLREKIREHQFHIDDSLVQLKVSLGVAIYPDHARDVSDLVKKAGQALVRAKEAGKDRVMVAF